MKKHVMLALMLALCIARPVVAAEIGDLETGLIVEDICEPFSESETDNTSVMPEGDVVTIDLADASDDREIQQDIGVVVGGEDEVSLSAENFPDSVFCEYLSKFDLDKNGSLNTEEIASVKEIDIEGKGTVSDLTGLSYFTGLETLMCDNNLLTSLDVSSNTKLKTLTCTYNQITGLDLRKNTKLMSLVCSNNQITELDLSCASNLQDLRCAKNKLEKLDLRKNTRITWLDCSGNKLTALDVPGCASLTYLFCNDNQISELNVSGDNALQWLECRNNKLSSLDVADALNVKNDNDSAFNLLDCSGNQLTTLVIGNKDYFKGLVCSDNMISGLDLTGLPDLRQLECANNALMDLDVSDNTKLQTLDCSGNHIMFFDLSRMYIDTTSVLPDCSGQQFSIVLDDTDTGYKADLSPFVRDGALRRVSEAGLSGSNAELGCVTLLDSEGELEGNILSFPEEQAPEVIRLACGTGYEKKPGDKDVFLVLELYCHAHAYADVPVVIHNPRCTEEGSEVLQCTECGFEKTVVLPAAGHKYERDPKSREATCTEDGLDKETCTVCGDSKEAVVPAKGHSYRRTSKAPTCTEDGYTMQKCSVCENEQVTEIPATGHHYERNPESRDATCTQDGIDKETCTICGATRETVLPALGHDYRIIKEKAADCENAGILQKECTRCKDRKEYLTMASGHSYRLTVRVAPDCTKDGYEKEECTICGKDKVTVLPATGHSFVKKETPATHTEDGIQWEECEACGMIQNRETMPRVNERAESGSGTQPLSIVQGNTLNLKKLFPAAGGKNVTYKSSNKKIAKVTKKGVVKGLKAGTVRITVKSGKKKYTIKIKVIQPAGRIGNVPSKKILKKGRSFQLKPTVTPAGKISYKSSNRKIASVTSDGKVKAKGSGTAKITVTAGAMKKVCNVIVP